MTTRRTGGGGSATASGISFQGYVGAWFASCHLLPDLPLHESLLGARVQSIVFETRLDVDDIFLITDRGYIFVQAKSNLSLSLRSDSEFAKIVDQFVSQWLECFAGQGRSAKSRALDSTRDRLLIAVGPESSRRISTDLSQGLEAVRAGGAANISKNKKKAVATLENQIKRAWCTHGSKPADDATIEEILSLITIRRYDFAGPDRESAEAFLTQWIEFPGSARATFSIIANHCVDLMAKRSGFNRDQLEVTLASNGMRSNRARSVNDNPIEQFLTQAATLQPLAVSYPVDIVDQTIENELDILRKSRSFGEFDSTRASLRLGRRVIDGNLQQGSANTRAKALAWCTRILSIYDKYSAESYLASAEALASCRELDIARAFLLAQEADVNHALSALRGMGTPCLRSAALILVKNARKARGAFSWLTDAGFSAGDLDSDGKLTLLSVLHELEALEKAKVVLKAVSEADYRSTPLLHRWVALTHLLGTVPDEYRSIVGVRVPFAARDFPLDSSSCALAIRQTARVHFERAAAVATELSCPRIARLDEEYAIWMDLRDPSRTKRGKCLLETRLRDGESTLHLVPLSVEFGIPLDHVDVNRQIAREIAVSGQTADAMLARFTMVANYETPERAVEYIAQQNQELSKFLNKEAIWTKRIELILKAGRVDEAVRCLEQMVAEGIRENQCKRVQGMIDEVQGRDPIELRRRQYESSSELDDLYALTEALAAGDRWRELCEYAHELFVKTKSLKAAEFLATGLLNSHRSEDLIEFLGGKEDLVEQSQRLGVLYSWALYQEGEIVKARAQLSLMGEKWDDIHYRSLWMTVGVALGNWKILADIVANQFENRAERGGQELIAVAEFAVHLNFPEGRDLVLSAVTAANEDPEVLLKAASLALECDWRDVDPWRWLERAATISGDEGPVWNLDISRAIQTTKEWDARAHEVWRLVNKGEAPLWTAAEAVGKSLADVMLVPALINGNESDPRRRAMVPAYSGARPEVSRPMPASIGLDATALLTLGFVDAIDDVLEAFDDVMVPHSTMGWLFAEERKVSFRQARRIRHARAVSDHIASGHVIVCSCPEKTEKALGKRIGEELATLIYEAEERQRNEGEQHIVVRSGPVYKIGPVVDAEADLREHVSVLRNCLLLLDKLRDLGSLTINEHQKAKAQLGDHERVWSEDTRIESGAVLYLDHVTVSHFLELGLLERLVSAGFKVQLSQQSAREATDFLRYQEICEQAKTILECTRWALGRGIESGTVRVGPLREDPTGSSESAWQHPVVSAISLASWCDVIAFDDRFVNRKLHVSDNSAETPIVTSLDVIDILVYRPGDSWHNYGDIFRGSYPCHEVGRSPHSNSTTSSNPSLPVSAAPARCRAAWCNAPRSSSPVPRARPTSPSPHAWA